MSSDLFAIAHAGPWCCERGQALGVQVCPDCADSGQGPAEPAPLVFCGQCAHHDLTGELGVHGYGLCNARPEHQRKGHFTSAENKCRTGKFTVKQPPKGT